MLRIDIMFNVGLWVMNSAVWAYRGHMGMFVLSALGVLGSVMLARLYAD